MWILTDSALGCSLFGILVRPKSHSVPRRTGVLTRTLERWWPMQYFGPSPTAKLFSVFMVFLGIAMLVWFSRWLVLSSPFPDLLEKALAHFHQQVCCPESEFVQVDLHVEIFEDHLGRRTVFIDQRLRFPAEEFENK